MRAVIVANGVPGGAIPDLFPEDILIAVDGGWRYCRKLNLRPHILIGDLDSLTPDEVDAAARTGIPVRRYPPRKDETDLELALSAARNAGADDIVIIAALGGRWDMTVANILLLAAPLLDGCRVRILEGPHEMELIRSGETRRFEARPGDLLSLIPLKGDACDVRVSGLEYPLKGETLFFGATRGISNVFTGPYASVFLGEGLLLCVIAHQESAF